MSEQNKALLRRFYDEVFHKKNVKAVDEFLAPNAVDHSLPPGTPQGREGVKQLLSMYMTAFPDMEMKAEDMIAEGDRLVSRWTATGTHKGPLMGIAPTGKRITISGIEIVRFQNGKMVEHWEAMDMLGMYQQLGINPSAAQGGR